MSNNSLGVLSLDLIVKTGGFEQGMDKADRIADRTTRKMEREAKARAASIEAAFTKMGTGIVAAWGALNLVQSVKGASDFADQLSKLSEKTGVTVESLSALNYAAGLSDATLEDLEAGFKGLSNKMVDAAKGSGESAEAFKSLGISVLDASGKLRPAEQVLLDIAESFAGMEDGAGKAALASALFSKSGTSLIPMLNGGREGLADMRAEAEKLGAVISTDFAKQSAELNDNITRMQSLTKGFATTIAQATVPALNELAKELLGAGTGTDTFSVAAAAAKTTVETLAITGANVAYVFNGVGRELGGIAAQLTALGSGDFKGFSAIGAAMRSDAEEARRQLDEFEKRIMNPPKPGETATPGRAKLAAPIIGGTPTTPAKTKGAYNDPLADAAKNYASVLDSLNASQLTAQTSSLDLTATQSKLLGVMTSPEWLQMPDAWKMVVAEQGEFTIAAEKAAAQQARLNELLGATPTAKLESQRETMAFLADAFDHGRISAEQFSEAASAALGNVAEAAKDTNDFAKELGMTFASSFEEAITSGKKFSDVLQGLLADVAKMMLRKNVTTPLANAVGNFNWGSLFSSTSTGSSATGLASLGSSVNSSFAKGGVFNSPSLHSYVNQVHDTPQPFKFAKGGVFGEAGPEAIMPLKRGADGKLGVSAAQGSNVSVEIHNYTGQQVQQKEVPDGRGGRKIEVIIGEAVAAEMRRSGSAANKAMRQPRMVSR